MSRSLRRAVAALVLVLTMWATPGLVEGQARTSITVRQMFDAGHRLEVSSGQEVVWADPHFERVWFPAGADDPKVQRVPGGFRAVFTKPGTYRGAFTVAGGHGTTDVYDMTVVVKPRP